MKTVQGVFLTVLIVMIQKHGHGRQASLCTTDTAPCCQTGVQRSCAGDSKVPGGVHRQGEVVKVAWVMWVGRVWSLGSHMGPHAITLR